MILNNTHIQGLFVYSDDIEFEKGDFVVLGNTIYTCIAENPTNLDNNTVSGKNPSTDPENFAPYLGDKIDNINDYFNLISSSSSSSKDGVLSAHLISEILNCYLLGMNEKGIISEYIYNGDEDNDILSISSGLSNFLESKDKESILDNLLTSEINNAVLKISRNLPEIKNLLPSVNNEDLIFNKSNLSYVILRQYTYSTSETDYSRLQEIIDPAYSITMFRSGSGTLSEDGKINIIDIGDFKRSYLEIDFMDNVRKLQKIFLDKITDLEKTKKSLINSFRFKEVSSINNSEVFFQCDNPEGNNYVNISGFDKESFVITVITQVGNVNVTTTIDILDSYLEIGGITSYYLMESSYLIVKPGTNTVSRPKEVSISVNNGKIVNIYYREKYKE